MPDAQQSHSGRTPTPTARWSYAATTVLCAIAAACYLAANRWDVDAVLIGVGSAALGVSALALQVPRWRTPRVVGPDREREAGSALTFAGLSIGFVGQGLNRVVPGDPDWLIVFPVLSLVVVAGSLARTARMRRR